MASLRDAFQRFVSMTPFVHRANELYAIFDHKIIMDVTMHKHQVIFVEAIDFMEGIDLERAHWVLCDLLLD